MIASAEPYMIHLHLKFYLSSFKCSNSCVINTVFEPPAGTLVQFVSAMLEYASAVSPSMSIVRVRFCRHRFAEYSPYSAHHLT